MGVLTVGAYALGLKALFTLGYLVTELEGRALTRVHNKVWGKVGDFSYGMMI